MFSMVTILNKGIFSKIAKGVNFSFFRESKS